MERIRSAVTTALVALFAIALIVPVIVSAQEEPDVSLVVVVLAPYLQWEDFDSGSVPVLRKIADEGALANVNVRSRAPGAVQGSLTAGALMLSTGSWAVDEPEAPGAYALDESYETGDVGAAYRRFMGVDPNGATVAYLGFPRAQRANDFEELNIALGSLGQAVMDAGGVTAAIGNSDAGYASDAVGRNRPAALVAMDERGLVALGDVSRRLLSADDAGPYGLSTDLERFSEELSQVLTSIGDRGGPGLLVLDPGDAHRAVSFSRLVSPEVAEQHRQQALETLDRVLSMTLENMPEDALLMVVTPVPVNPDQTPLGLATGVVFGNDWSGYIRSASTHRVGLATLSDFSVTALDALGIERPVEMMGNTLTPEKSEDALEARLARLEVENRTAVSIDGAKTGVHVAYIVLTVALLLLATLFAIRPSYPPWVARFLRTALLLLLALPVGTYLMFALERWPQSESGTMLFLVGATLVAWVVSLAVGWNGRWVGPLMGVSVLTSLVLLFDIWLGSPLSFTGFLSYSPLTATRYYGMGNEGAGLLFGSLLVGVALAMDEAQDAKWVRPFARWVLPIVGGIAVLTAAAPTLGANVGVAVWGVVCIVVMWASSNGQRPNWRVAAVVLVIVVLVIGTISWLDLSGGTETHLARALAGAERGGLDELRVIIERKVETNVRVLTSTNWTYVLLAVLALLAFMRWRPRGEFMEALRRFPHFGHAMSALLLGGLFAYFTEDSGIVVPAFMLLYPGAGVLYLMLGREREQPGAE